MRDQPLHLWPLFRGLHGNRRAQLIQQLVEGLLAQGYQGLDVGDKLRVKLTRTDVQHGYIDFVHA
jgi:hypothetical protein